MKRRNLLILLAFFSNFHLSYAQIPSNDECSGAIVLQTTNFDKGKLEFENATNSIDGCGGVVNDIWFSFKPNSEVVQFDTDNGYDPTVEIYDACNGAIVDSCFALQGFFKIYVDDLDTSTFYYIRTWSPNTPLGEETAIQVQDFFCELQIDSVDVSEASCYDQDDGQIKLYFNNPYDGFGITNARVHYEGITTGIGGSFDSYSDEEIINDLAADQYLIRIVHSGYSNCFIESDTIRVGIGSNTNPQTCQNTPLNPMSIRWPRHYTNIKYSGSRIECNNGIPDTIYSTQGHKILVPMSSPFECADSPGTLEPIYCDPGSLSIGVFYEDSISFNGGQSCWTKWRKWTIIDSLTWIPSDPNASNDFDIKGAFLDLAFGDCYHCPNLLNVEESHFAYTMVDVDGYYNFTQRIDVVDDTKPVIESLSTHEVAVGMTCEGSGVLSSTVSEYCGATQLSADAVEWFIERYNGDGDLVATKTAFGTSATMSTGVGYAGESATIKWSANDGCGNIATTYTFISFSDLAYSETDSDKDGIGNLCDNCPLDFYNDIDGDGVCGDIDNCPSLYNPNQEPAVCDFSQYTDCRLRDSLALVAFYNTTLGHQWVNQWDLLQPVTSWYGVKTNGAGCVTNLSLYSNKLKGYLPEEIGFLYDLKVLDLTQNAIQGSIPSSIGNLTELTQCNIWRNRLSGELPMELWTLSQLESLDLGGNGGITGEIPSLISNLPNLINLGLWGNQISGVIPDEIGTLSQLIVLSISYNSLEGPIPESIGNLSKLVTCYLSNNQLTGSLSDTISNMKELVSFEVHRNRLSGELPASLATLPKIENLFLGTNGFSGCFPLSYISNFCDINFNSNSNPFLPFNGDIRQICDNGLTQDFDGDGVCVPQDCDDFDPNVTADTLAPFPVCQNIVLPLGDNGFVSLYAGSHLVSTSQIVIDTIIVNNDTSYVQIEIQDPIDDCTPNENVLVDFSLDGLNFSTYAGFSCEQLGRHDLLIAVTDYGMNKSVCSITIDVVDNSIPQVCPCTEEKMIVNDTVYAPLYSAQMDIMDLGTMIGGDSVKYQAGNSIALNPVFIVPVGHVFEAEIDDCNN